MQVGDGFLRTLVEDVAAALQRISQADTEGHRRDAVRTIFAAIEGVTWFYREHVRRTADDLGMLTTAVDLALQEKSYTLGSKGNLIEQIKFTPLTSMIKFVAKVAEETCGGSHVNFGQAGWDDLQRAITVRNRITHPKTRADLVVTAQEVAIAETGFVWLLNLVVEGMAAAQLRLVRFNKDAQELVDALKNGDPIALAEYRAALAFD